MMFVGVAVARPARDTVKLCVSTAVSCAIAQTHDPPDAHSLTD
jgi:hypothetical protein